MAKLNRKKQKWIGRQWSPKVGGELITDFDFIRISNERGNTTVVVTGLDAVHGERGELVPNPDPDSELGEMVPSGPLFRFRIPGGSSIKHTPPKPYPNGFKLVTTGQDAVKIDIKGHERGRRKVGEKVLAEISRPRHVKPEPVEP